MPRKRLQIAEFQLKLDYSSRTWFCYFVAVFLTSEGCFTLHLIQLAHRSKAIYHCLSAVVHLITPFISNSELRNLRLVSPNCCSFALLCAEARRSHVAKKHGFTLKNSPHLLTVWKVKIVMVLNKEAIYPKKLHRGKNLRPTFFLRKKRVPVTAFSRVSLKSRFAPWSQRISTVKGLRKRVNLILNR